MQNPTDLNAILTALELSDAALTGGESVVSSPIDGSEIARVRPDTPDSTNDKIEAAAQAWRAWRLTPAPRRGS